MPSATFVVLIVTLLKSSCCARAAPATSVMPRKTSRLTCFMARTIERAAVRLPLGSPRKSPKIERRPTPASGPSKPRQRPTLPQGCPCSTIGPEELNFRVRDGNGCDLFGIAARKKNHEVRSSAGQKLWPAGQTALPRGSAIDRLRTALKSSRMRPSQALSFNGCAIADGFHLLPARLDLPRSRERCSRFARRPRLVWDDELVARK